MRLIRLRHNGWAAGLGVVALALNALISVHLAFDLTEALGRSPHSHDHARAHGFEWHLLAALSGHVPHAHDHDHDQGHHGTAHHPNCAVGSSLGSLAGLLIGSHPGLSAPLSVAAAPDVAALFEVYQRAPAPAYRSRAPPLLSQPVKSA